MFVSKDRSCQRVGIKVHLPLYLVKNYVIERIWHAVGTATHVQQLRTRRK